MSRKTDLEGFIRDSYGIIHEYERQIQFEDRPEVKMRAQRSIDQQWAHIEGYWSEYRPLAGNGVPEDIAQITARFDASTQPPLRPVDVPTHQSSQMTVEHRQELVKVIARYPAFSGGAARGRSVVLAMAGLERFLPTLELSGPPRTVAGLLVSTLENYGPLPDRPGYHALGTLLSYLISLEDLPVVDAAFVATLIVKYRLVADPAYVAELVARYGIVRVAPLVHALSDLCVDLLKALQDPDDHEGYTVADLERIFGQPKSKLRYNLETLIDRGMAGRHGSPSRYYRLPPGLAYLIENDLIGDERPVSPAPERSSRVPAEPMRVFPARGVSGEVTLSRDEKRAVQGMLDRWAAQAPLPLGLKGYLSMLIDSTGWPRRDQVERVQGLTGISEYDAMQLVSFCLSRKTNPEDERYTYLGDLLVALMKRVGLEDREYLAALIATRGLVEGSVLGELDVPVPQWAGGSGPDVGPDLEWQGPTDDLVLEGYLRPEPNLQDVGWLRQAIQRAESVCLIQYRTPQGQERPSATGFLVGEGLVLTNYHVLQDPRFPGDVLLENVPHARLYFGQVTVEGGEVTRGREFEPVGGAGAVLASSPVKELDYALLRVEPIDAQTGWQGIRPAPYTLELPDEREGLHIIGHPVIGSAEAEEGVPMMLAQSGSGITWVSEAEGKLQYWTRSAGGSSGSPCFNDSLQLVALHHARRSKPFGSRGEGILFKSIHGEIVQFL
ncbi:MAG: trypsin-like peptidase domain-containing protein [Anaerolineae bacterium]|nr:trypsin-like peptidase domain-containing protein [Anaerolineae bacterium]